MVLRTFPLVLLSAGVIHLSGCDRAGEERSRPGPVIVTATPVDSTTVAPLSGEPASTAVAAADPAVTLSFWKQAMERRDWAGAWRMWGDGGKASGMSAQEYASRWQRYRTLSITIGEIRQEGAAGSSFAEVPVTISGERQDRSPYRHSGILTMRRVNDVPGATPEQLRWHIERSTLAP